MNRKEFILGLMVLGGIKANAREQRRFYITGLFHTETLNDCTIPPIECYGTDRIDAYMNWAKTNGCTVWTEQEWKSTDQSGFIESCKPSKVQP